jgi:phosphatidylglycerol---prolipoprotein diacylglyceryl transferase
MPPLAYWVHDIDPVLLPIYGNFAIRYYGLAYLLGFFGGWWLLSRYVRAGRGRLPAAQVTDLMTNLIIGVLIGGRLGYFVLYAPATLWKDPLALFQVWDGGMASHGGFLGVAAALAWTARRAQVPMLHLGDLVVTVAPLGLFFGRIANFINGELWGRPTFVSWAVLFPQSTLDGAPLVPRHPSQLYGAALEGLLLLAVMQLLFWRTTWWRERVGRLSGAFLLGYALVRTVDELFREPDAGVSMISLGGLALTRGQFYSLFVAAAGLWLLLRRADALQFAAELKAPVAATPPPSRRP